VIRILLLRLPRLVRDLLAERLGAEPDLEVVDAGEAPGDGAAAALARLEPDVVVVGLGADERPLVWAEMLGRLPHLKLLALEERGRDVSLYELRPTRTRLGPLSPSDVVAAVRRALRPMPLLTRDDDAVSDAGDAADAGNDLDARLAVSLARDRSRP